MLLQRSLQCLQELVYVCEDLKRHWRSIVAKGMCSLHELRWEPTKLRRKTLAKLSVLSEQASDLLTIATAKSAWARRAAALVLNRCGETTLQGVGRRSPQRAHAAGHVPTNLLAGFLLLGLQAVLRRPVCPRCCRARSARRFLSAMPPVAAGAQFSSPGALSHPIWRRHCGSIGGRRPISTKGHIGADHRACARRGRHIVSGGEQDDNVIRLGPLLR